MNYPLSIITINYNNASGLERTMQSLCNQKNKTFEHIVIDGGSTDLSVEILKNNSNNLSYWVSEQDRGIYHAMNKGIAVAKGAYLLFINSGDELNGSDILLNTLQHVNNADLITCNLQIISGNTERVKTYPENPTYQYFLADTFPHPATFIRKQLFTLTNGYDENFKIVSDWAFFMTALFRFNATHKHLPIILSRFYMDGISSQLQNRQLVANERARFLSEQFPRFSVLVAEWQEGKKVKFIFENSRLVKIAKSMGLLKPPREL